MVLQILLVRTCRANANANDCNLGTMWRMHCSTGVLLDQASAFEAFSYSNRPTACPAGHCNHKLSSLTAQPFNAQGPEVMTSIHNAGCAVGRCWPASTQAKPKRVPTSPALCYAVETCTISSSSGWQHCVTAGQATPRLRLRLQAGSGLMSPALTNARLQPFMQIRHAPMPGLHIRSLPSLASAQLLASLQVWRAVMPRLRTLGTRMHLVHIVVQLHATLLLPWEA